MKKQSRNDPCHCGSGKKFKNCHAGQTNNNFNQQWVIVGIIGGIFLLYIFMDSGTSTTTTMNNSIPTSVIPQATARSATPPPGDAPPGKVWSPEHGHWHNISTNSASMLPGAEANIPQPQPLGEAPPGKVWSSEHGHWHDIQ